MLDSHILTAKDFDSGVEVKWCPGCGDYSILKQVQTILPQIGVPKENIVFISGIGCAGRFPYYMNTYGLHTIHGRATAIASGVKMANPNLDVWVITGDGDGFSIGLGHTMHTLRRNMDMNILLFNNQIYGLTKGQYSPTSEQHKITASTPLGSLDFPFNPLALVLAADTTFIARSIDRNPKHLQKTLLGAAAHKGTSFVEIYQNCNIFNDKTFDLYLEKQGDNVLFLESGEPLLFGVDNKKGILLDGYKPKIVNMDDGTYTLSDLWIHDEADLFKAQILVRFFDSISYENHFPRPFGVFYENKGKPCYEALLTQQIQMETEKKGIGRLEALLKGDNFWETA